MTEANDAELISRYLAGDKGAMEILISRYLKPVYGFVYRYADNPADAEDIAQETFLRLLRNLNKFQPNKSFKAWLFTIAKNVALDFIKKKKTIPFSALTVLDNEGEKSSIIETLSDPAPWPDELFDRANLAAELNAAINELPLKYQSVLLLHYQQQLTFQEISEIESEPLNTVKNRHLRALLKLKAILAI
ncbi:MAG: sigma-70 family RNA polymerase sigma factor [Candidatus Komeilibacteria bacterium]|nr:sigma-70 family RNA polymerase sigma factor [Candidatus Komeilibacteria bacterium]